MLCLIELFIKHSNLRSSSPRKDKYLAKIKWITVIGIRRYGRDVYVRGNR